MNSAPGTDKPRFSFRCLNAFVQFFIHIILLNNAIVVSVLLN